MYLLISKMVVFSNTHDNKIMKPILRESKKLERLLYILGLCLEACQVKLRQGDLN